VKNKDDISKTDKLLWEEYTKDPKDVFDKEIGIKKKYIKLDLKLIYMDIIL